MYREHLFVGILQVGQRGFNAGSRCMDVLHLGQAEDER